MQDDWTHLIYLLGGATSPAVQLITQTSAKIAWDNLFLGVGSVLIGSISDTRLVEPRDINPISLRCEWIRQFAIKIKSRANTYSQIDRTQLRSKFSKLHGFWNKLYIITIFVNLGLFRHFETVTNIRTSIKSHIYWRML
jgi:hypothetical protein